MNFINVSLGFLTFGSNVKLMDIRKQFSLLNPELKAVILAQQQRNVKRNREKSEPLSALVVFLSSAYLQTKWEKKNTYTEHFTESGLLKCPHDFKYKT